MKPKVISKILVLTILTSLLLVACGGDTKDEAATARPEQVNNAQTAFAQPTNTPRTRATVTPLPSIETELARTTARMARAVLEQDGDAYFAQVWSQDEVFLAEQQGWAEFWLNEKLVNYTLSLSLIEGISETEARARMTVIWKREGDDRQAGGATLTVRFLKEDATSTTWLFAGEAWEVVRLFWNGANWTQVTADDTVPTDAEERMRVYYLPTHGPIDGTVDGAQVLLQDLPGVYNVVLEDLDYEPTQLTHVRLYDGADNLRFMARLDASPQTQYWNKPNEAVRFSVDSISKQPPEIDNVANALTEAVFYQIAGNTSETFPFWVMIGTTRLIVGRNYQTRTWINNDIEFALEQLPNTEAIEPEDSPLLQTPVNALVGHIFLVYLDETFGESQRNDWLKTIISGEDIDTATQSVFEKSLEEISADWLIWLSQQL